MPKTGGGTSLKTPRTRLKRRPKRGAYDFKTIAAILDEAFYCHVGFVAHGKPYVIPTNYEVSAKIRTGPPIDDEEDYALKCWAGVMPLKIVPGEPIADPRLPRDIPVPDYALKFPRPG